MKLIRGLHNLKPCHGPAVATIGNFDGLHRGHQQLLARLKDKAKEYGMPTTVILFEPQPEEFFAKGKPAARLTRLREKLLLLEKMGISQVLLLRFNKVLAKMPAKAFVEEILVKELRVRYVLLGDDFRFGYERQGDFSLVQQLGMEYNFEVARLSSVEYQGHRVSSTAVRSALAAGDLNYAEGLLGRPYSLCGRVAHGEKRGSTIGFPTANIYLHRVLSPLFGVYCVKVHGLHATPVYGVANLGNRPTVDGTRTLLEVHLFDFNERIYGRYVQVDFIHKLREEKRYDSFELLKQQIFLDVNHAKAFFKIGDS